MSSESHQACLDGRVAIEMDEVNRKMDPMGRAILDYVKRQGRAADYHKTGTADIKDLYVDDKPFLALIASLLKKGVEVRLIHAKEPGTAWREDHEKHPILYDGMERVLCPRVHFKLIIIDSSIGYVGSANLTGAGMGMKSPKKRNFEAGILTDDPEMLDAAIEQFDNVWIGKFCKDCGRREYCSDPIK